MPEPRLPTVDDLAELVNQRAGEPQPRNQLRVAVTLGRELTQLSDALIGRFVAHARAGGLSWTEIGDAFGITKQAAQQRYGTTIDDSYLSVERWTGACRETLDRAGEEARRLGHDYVGTEHLLLALLSAEGSVAADVLRAVGITRERLLSTSCMTPASGAEAAQAHLAFMPRLKQALEHARRIADGLEARHADTEHLLAGIVAVPDSMAVEILRRLRVSDADVVSALAERLAVEPERLGHPRRRRRRRPAVLTRTR
jgi:hypothetical protein